MSSHLTPLEVCARMIAPVKDLGELMGMHAKSAYAWRRGSDYREPGDMPPRVNRKMLKYAKAKAIPLKAEHLIWGADRDEIEALLETVASIPVPGSMPTPVAAE